MTFQRILHFAPISPIEFHITTVFKEIKKGGKIHITNIHIHWEHL